MKRRHFSQGLGILAAAQAPFLSSTFGQNGFRRIKIGQIGTKHAHAAGKLSAIQQYPDLFELVGVVEPDEAQWASVSSREPYLQVSRLSEEELFATDGLEAVAVETAVAELVPTALRCLAREIHLHVDKPAGSSLSEATEMFTLANEKGLLIQMGYMLRYLPAFEKLRALVTAGALGEVTEINAMMGKLSKAGTREELSLYPGGGMFELACHLIDQVVTFLGPPEKVTAFTRQTRSDGVADNQLAVLEYEKALASVRCNHVDPFGGPRREFSVTGTKGTASLRPLESGSLELKLSEPFEDLGKGSHSFELPYVGGRYGGEFRDFAAVVREDKPFAWGADHDVAVHRAVLEASGMPTDG
ncbi:MAG: Gfo/Idh/MocA family oxidoreductase [Verrucomicrobiota bacterium]